VRSGLFCEGKLRVRDEDNDNENDELPRVAPGRVRFDDKGNSVWVPPRYRVPRTPLEIVDDQPHPARPAENVKGVRSGYNPYESGMLTKEKRKKTDLRALSQWIELRRRIENDK
jgi:hypothetical protein